jgi:hypothetical protein
MIMSSNLEMELVQEEAQDKVPHLFKHLQWNKNIKILKTLLIQLTSETSPAQEELEAISETITIQTKQSNHQPNNTSWIWEVWVQKA